MRVPVSWLREYVDAPTDPRRLESALVSVGLEVEEMVDLRESVTGPFVVGRVVGIEELTGFKKPIRHCRVEVGESAPREIICGATNFVVGDLVPVALPGAVLPGGFAIGARKAYGRMSDGMICSERELGVGDDHSGILVLPTDSARPGDDARPHTGLDEVVVELAVTPDRGYCFSVRGIARELAHALRRPFTDPADHPVTGPTAEPAYPVTVADPSGCDRFATRLVRGIDPHVASPDWLRRRLLHAGMRPLGLAVDITNYLMLELGQPMHAFDPHRLQGPLVVRRARAGERITTLDGVDRALDPADMVICDDRGPVSLAAVMGGANSEITDGSVDVLFEAAHWDPVMVARTARRHKLASEAAKRWERGVDPTLPPVALQRAVELLTTYAGGTVDERVGDINTVAPPVPVPLDPGLPARIAGVPYPPGRTAEALTEIGCSVVGVADESHLTVTPPPWRPDLTDPADLVEEVVRLDGYDRVPSELPTAPAGAGLTRGQRRRRTVARTLAEAGYVEALCYPFVGDAAWDALGLDPDDPRRRTVRLANPLSEQDPQLRTTLLPPLLTTLRRNLSRGAKDVALYELGAVFHPRTGSAEAPPAMGVDGPPPAEQLAIAEGFVPEQPWHVATVLTGNVWPAGWWGSGRPADWADAVASARAVLDAAGVGDRVAVEQSSYAPWHPGRCARVWVDEIAVGYAGELHPQVCDAFDLPKRTCAMELDLSAVPGAEVVSAPAISGYPPALIDVALVVDEAVPSAQVRAALAEGAGELLESVELFDVYTGEQLGAGRRSLAYKLIFRAGDRTLTAEEAVRARDEAVAEAHRRVGATLRS